MGVDQSPLVAATLACWAFRRWEELSHLSMVLSRYGIPGQISGAVGVLGPTRINYGRAISAVSYVSGLMTDMLTDVYEGLPPGDSQPDI